MGVFRQFPYSNFHEMNMDEIIKIVKTLAEEWAEYQLKWSNLYDDTETALNDFKEWAYHYFDNLNVQNEINFKIDSMVADGTFNNIVIPSLSPVVTSWLSEHITVPSGVVIDSSLTIAGACADAKATGDAIKETDSHIDELVDSLVIGDSYDTYLTPAYTQGRIHERAYNNPLYDAVTCYSQLFSIENKDLHINVEEYYKALVVFFASASDNSPVTTPTWLTGNNIITVSDYPSSKLYFSIEVRRTDNTTLLPTDANKVTAFYSQNFDYYNKEETEEVLLPIKQYLGMADPTANIHFNDYVLRTQNTRLYSDSLDEEHELKFIHSISVAPITGYLTTIVAWNGVTGEGASTAWSSGSSYTNDNTWTYFGIGVRKTDNSAFTQEEVETFINNVVITVDRKVLNAEISDNVYVSTTGSDDNEGTSDYPFATIQKAVDSGKPHIIVEAGTYTGNVVISNVDEITIEVSDYTNNINISEKPKIIINANGSANGIYINNVRHAVLRDIDVYNSDHAPIRAINVRDMECVNVVVHDNTLTYFLYSGIELVNVTGKFINCTAYNIDRDGFNIHGIGHTEFIDCIAHDCNDDGISHHEKATGVIRGGEYYQCGKGGVSSPFGASHINVENVYSHNNAMWGIMCGAEDGGACFGNITNCVAKNNTNKDIRIYGANSRIVGWNNIYDTKQLDDNSTFIEY